VATVQSSGESLPLGNGVYDAALALDVLEHIDDEAAARELARVLRPGGLLFVTVPAFSFLWGVRDIEAGHRRRYRRAGLERLLRGAGLTVEESGYYQFWLFPLTVLSRLAGRQSARTRDMEDLPSGWINRLFSKINRWEVRLGETVRWPWGSSLYVVARKEGTARAV
jgi:SAM-dependent methyltransferase